MANCALLISPSSEGWFMPALLARAGWRCDVVSLSGIYRLSAHVHRLHLVGHVAQLADEALRVFEQENQYDWVIPASDDVLGELCRHALIDRRFLALLPITRREGRSHLFSKLNLSRALSRHGVPTPAWLAVDDLAKVLQHGQALGYPCFAKRDRSYGGAGTVRCDHPAALQEIGARLEGETFLLQQGLTGKLWGVEALYWQGQLRAFAASLCLRTTHLYGPSLERRYGQIPAGLDALLQLLGDALCAHGWANITFIQPDDGELQCIEADLRPTIWLALDEHLGGDFAKVVQYLERHPVAPAVQCYSGLEQGQALLVHPQRLVQVGAPDRQIQKSMKTLPEEAPAFLDELHRQKFSALLPVDVVSSMSD
jgi:hypothetical protein